MVINDDMLKIILDEFILESISSRIVSINQGSEKCKVYVVDLNNSNDKNDLHHMLRRVRMENIDLSHSCIYIDINKARQNPYLNLISTINNL